MTAEPLFEQADDYDAMLDQGIRLSGEDKAFFIDGRIAWLAEHLPATAAPRRILDFACGVGDATAALARAFPGAVVVGVDRSGPAVEAARAKHAGSGVEFVVGDVPPSGPFDLCYVNGAFHHIDADQQPAAMSALRGALAPDGWLALFENNPWNPGARLVMRRIPFDRDAVMLAIPRARRLVRDAGFGQLTPTTTLFWFPAGLGFLRPFERRLARLPGGAQYLVLARA